MRPQERTGLGQIWAAAAGLGLSMGACAAIAAVGGLLAGRWLDSRLGTGPLLTIIGTVAGVVVGQAAVYRLALRAASEMGTRHGAPPASVRAVRMAGLALAAIGRLVAPMAIGLVAGIALSRASGASEWLAIAGILVGSIVGMLWSVCSMGRVFLVHKGKCDE